MSQSQQQTFVQDNIQTLESLRNKLRGIDGTQQGRREVTALTYAIQCLQNPLVEVKETQVLVGPDDAVTLKMKNLQLINLLGDIISEATNNPARLTSFNSPVLQLAVMEVFEHNNPDQPVDDRSRQIFQQMALVAYNG